MPITIPTGPVAPTATAPGVTLIYGPPKIGKTTSASVLPSSLLVDIENGSNYVTATKLKLDNILQFGQLEEQIKAKGRPFKYGILDTMDKLEEWAEIEATRRFKGSVIGKSFGGDSILTLPNGGGYFHLRNVFYEYFKRFCALFDRTIFIGHIRDRMLGVEGSNVSMKDLDLTGKIRNIACSYADAIGYMYRDKDGKLKLSFQTTDTVSCGSRCDHLKGKVFDFHSPTSVEDWKQVYPDIT